LRNRLNVVPSTAADARAAKTRLPISLYRGSNDRPAAGANGANTEVFINGLTFGFRITIPLFSPREIGWVKNGCFYVAPAPDMVQT